MKKHYLKWVSLLIAVMIPVGTFAQTKELSGKVVDEKGEAIPFVNAVLLSLPDSVIVVIMEFPVNFVFGIKPFTTASPSIFTSSSILMI